MSFNLKRVIIRNLASPFGLALISYGIFLFTWVFPPSLYTRIMSEKDYVFLDWETFLFYSICTAGFLLGVIASRLSFASTVKFLFGLKVMGLRPAPNMEDRSLSSTTHVSTGQMKWLPLVLPLAVSIFLGCTTLVVFGTKTDNLTLILAQQADVIKYRLASETPPDISFWSKLVPLIPVHMAIIWWFAFRLWQAQFSRTVHRRLTALMWLAVLVATANSVMRAERVTLMPILAGLLTIYVYTTSQTQTERLWPILKPFAIAAVGILVLFFVLSIVRGQSLVSNYDPSEQLLGYTIVAYNHLAALLNGTLRFDYVGNIQDLCKVCSENKYINAVFPYEHFFNIPDEVVSWSSEFSATGAAGLSVGYNYPSVFGYVFRDIGWWSPVYFSCQGVIIGWAWESFRKGRVLGIMLYPWFAFCILFWFGWNIAFSNPIFYMTLGAIVLNLYDKFVLKSVKGGNANSVTTLRGEIPGFSALPL